MKYWKITRLTVALVALIMMALTAVAETPQIKFQRLDTRDGLSNSQVNCILKDSKGFVWLGTKYGLSRYDGYRFRVFHSSTKDTVSLLNDHVDNVYEDIDGYLWVQQETKYCVYDPKKERFIHDLSPWCKKVGMTNNVEKVFIDRDKNYWMKPWEGDLYYYNPRTGTKARFDVINNAFGVKGKQTVTSIASYGRSTLVMTNCGVLMSLIGEEKRVSWVSKHIKKVQPHEAVSRRIYVDRKGNYWVTSEGRCYVYDHRYKRWFDSLTDYLRCLGIGGMSSDVIIGDVQEDNLGRMWVATDHSGLFIIDYAKRELYNYNHDKSNESSVSDHNLLRLYRSLDNQMWIGTYTGGVNQVVLNKDNVKNVALGSINTVTEDKEGNYWLGTNDNGIIRYNPVTGERQSFTMASHGLSSDIIVTSRCASDGTLWFGTFGGGLIHYANGKFTAMRKGTLSDDNVWAVVESADKNIWIGTLGGGVQCIEKDGKISTYNQTNSHLSSNYVSSMQITPEGWIVVGTSNNYSLIDPKKCKVVNMKLDQDATRSSVVASACTQVLMDSRGLVWYCSSAGVNVLDNTTGVVTLLDQESGLSGNNVCSVIEDSRHNIWVVTEYGISYIQLTMSNGEWKYDIRNYNNRDGLQPGPYNQRSVCLTSDRHVLVGGSNGLDIIDPERLGSQKIVGYPVFSGFLLYGQQIEVGKEYDGHVILPEAINESRRVELKHNENQFTIQMASDQGLIKNRSQYVYRLDGFSDKWMKTEAGNPNISFTGLSSGKYTLVVKLLDDRNQMGVDESRLEIVVRPPFWATWWAYIIYAIVVAVLVRMWHHRETKKLRLEKLKMEKEEEMRKRREAKTAYDNISDELRLSFDNIFTKLDTLMSGENDERRYEQQQQVFDSVETLMTQISEMKPAESQKATPVVRQEKLLITPTITDVQIVSLDQKLVDAATKYVEDNLSNGDITVETMSEAMNMSRVHLYKRLTAITGMTPSEFIRDIRLRHAEQLILKSQLSVSEISYKVGFNNPRYFSKYFREKYGVIPSQYKGDNGVSPS